MAVSKDTEKGTWTSQIWVEDWQGKKKHKKKRGFSSKKEALEWERNTLLASKTDMNMKLADFVEVYFRDKDGELKQRTIRNKRYMIEHHIIPLLGNKAMDGITPSDIIQWQNEIRSKGFKETYRRMLQNQMTALFTHATKIYNLKDNPCTKVKRMGRADADKKQLQFLTLDEFNCFIETFDLGSKYHVLFELLFYSGCRIGEALALTASDIDTVNRRISITKTYFRHKGKDEITEPKTRESVRTVIIPEFLAEELKAYMASMYKLPADERIFAVVPEADRLPQYVKLETALGACSFPTEVVEIRNYIGDYLAEKQREDLIEQFSLGRLSMNLQSLERTYIDKVFALCDYFMQGRAKRCSRHLYDIYKLSPMVKFDEEFAKLVGEVREHRAQMSICLSAMPGVHVPEIITQFCDAAFYEKDYQDITSYFAADYVPYEDTIAKMREIAAGSLFVEA